MHTLQFPHASQSQSYVENSNPYFEHLIEVGRSRGWVRDQTSALPKIDIPQSDFCVVLDPQAQHLRLLHAGTVLTAVTLARRTDLNVSDERRTKIKGFCVAQIELQLEFER